MLFSLDNKKIGHYLVYKISALFYWVFVIKGVKLMKTIRKRHEFIALRDKGVKKVSKAFILQARPIADDIPPLYGLTASKKIGNAVVRNRARRRMRALVRTHLAAKARIGYHYGLIARFAIADMPYAQLEAHFCEAIDAVHKQCDK